MKASEGDRSAREWIGRQETREDLITAFPVAALTATLDRTDASPRTGDALRPLRHWLYFLSHDARSALGPDGHAARGGFLPPIALPRRMWAGSRLRFEAPIRVGTNVRRISTIADVTEKSGRSGRLAFVTVRHAIYANETLLVREDHDIVYRDAPPPADPPSTVSDAHAQSTQPSRERPDEVRLFRADETLLFRYSALTFNGHRIHYDRRYVTEHEGYPGLVVHGPLLATLLADLALDINPGATLSTFAFRARSPVFDGTDFRVCAKAATGATTELWIATSEGAVAMEAIATFAPGQ